jgi:tetratricopeptide (TPR) repeat protein
MMGWIFRLDNSPTPPSEILENAVKAVRLDPSDAYAHRTAAYGYYFRKQFDAFEAEALEAIRLAPYNAEIYAQIGMLFAFNGQWERGTRLVEKAFAINPISAAAWGHSALYYNHYRLQQYKKALNVMMSHPSTFLCENQMKFVAVYGQLGRPEKAKEHWANCEKTVPNVSADLWAHVMRVWNFQKPFIEHYVQGIEKAGYPCRSTPCGLQHSEQAGKEQG